MWYRDSSSVILCAFWIVLPLGGLVTCVCLVLCVVLVLGQSLVIPKKNATKVPHIGMLNTSRSVDEPAREWRVLPMEKPPITIDANMYQHMGHLLGNMGKPSFWFIKPLSQIESLRLSCDFIFRLAPTSLWCRCALAKSLLWFIRKRFKTGKRL